MMISAGSLTATGSTTQDQLKHHRLVDAAQSFEASFLGELLKGANFSGKEDNGSGEAGDDTMASYGREALGKALSAAGGFGIARSVVARMEPQAHSGSIAAMADTLTHGTTGASALAAGVLRTGQ